MINDVVRKEVIKLLDAGIVYPILDSKCVSLVQCVPKKGIMTVVTNDKNELIPTRNANPYPLPMMLSLAFPTQGIMLI